ncbi:MAG: alpha-E domain-containing protein [Eubacteriales bacterium]|nr:alpha-E domain-containing protein [Eubacteriales bacterium]
MGIISLEKANNLLWLGRYTERVYTTIRKFFVQFDKMIDTEEDQYSEFCKKLNIPVIYTSNEQFAHNYIYDRDNPDSIISNLLRAYDNAILLRDEIGTETLSYLQLAIDKMSGISRSKAPLLELQNVLDMLLAFWACADDFIIKSDTRNIIKTGKSMERIDLYLRLGSSEIAMFSEFEKLQSRIRLSGLDFSNHAMIRLSYFLYCEEEDHPEIEEMERKQNMMIALEQILDF